MRLPCNPTVEVRAGQSSITEGGVALKAEPVGEALYRGEHEAGLFGDTPLMSRGEYAKHLDEMMRAA